MIEGTLEEEFRRHLQRDILLAHDPQYCYYCKRSIVGRPSTIELRTDEARWVWHYCQQDHIPSWDNYPEPPEKPFRKIASPL